MSSPAVNSILFVLVVLTIHFELSLSATLGGVEKSDGLEELNGNLDGVQFEGRSKRSAPSNIRIRRDTPPVLDAQELGYQNKLLTSYPDVSQVWLNEILEFTNKLRELHKSPRLTLNYTLSYLATNYAAMKLGHESWEAGKIVLKHDNYHMYEQGETMGARRMGTREQLLALPGSFAARNWYEEIKDHDWSKNYWQWNSGHFSQLIWGASKHMGCGRFITEEECNADNTAWKKPPILIIVCRFEPPGNWLIHDAYNSHVKKPTDGRTNPNAFPDFKKLCPAGATTGDKCPKPYVCCTDKSKPIDGKPTSKCYKS